MNEVTRFKTVNEFRAAMEGIKAFKDSPASKEVLIPHLLDMLNQSYQEYYCEYKGSKKAFVGLNVFDMCTYDEEMSEHFCDCFMGTVNAITDGKTFEHIENKDNYISYLWCINHPSIKNKIDWGTSIRGAWWAHGKFVVSSCGIVCDGEQITKLSMNRDGWIAFIAALNEFLSHE